MVIFGNVEVSDKYEHVKIPDNLINYVGYIKSERRDGVIVLYVDKDDKTIIDTKLWKGIREKRDKLLIDSDFYMLSDYPIDDINKNECKRYRQRLRDIPQEYTLPYDIIWPTPPIFIKKIEF